MTKKRNLAARRSLIAGTIIAVLVAGGGGTRRGRFAGESHGEAQAAPPPQPCR